MEKEGEGAGEADPYARNLQLFSCFAGEKWEAFDATEKITIMQKLVDFETERLGIPKIPITAGTLEAYTLGQYNHETNEMQIDVSHLMESPAEESVSTVCHEVFHSAQQYLVDQIDWDEEVFQSAYFAELRSWKQNQESYKDAWTGGYDAYENQPLEASAREYAETETEKIFSYVASGSAPSAG